MWTREKKRNWMGVIGGAGVVAVLAGVFGLVPLSVALFAGIAIWIMGATVINLLAG
ncbi:hypothetical protein [Roseovarius indicus]|uniref:Uncharacterized protein n=1 Tax=Roseovarius indicus TaxID=540747 RepID=A0A5P3AE20_9RHOB|nr:hypothetical protein [Roseovarius indicus]QEW27016.1 hypothetical protein RIdsm_02825 [Roseovarius indicus]SFD55794.1 hypothetical protein SAMN04488031_101520 [Roseovarius indicus]